MKKNKLLFFILIIPLMVFIHSCMDDDINSQPPKPEVLSIQDARQCFQDYMSDFIETRSHGHECNGDCTHNHDYPLVAEFTPQWGRAVVSNSANLASVDVPVISEKYFVVLQKALKKNKKGKDVCIMNVLQKLIVVKNPATGNTGVYHALIVPAQSYVESHGQLKFDDFYNSGDKKDFSGAIIYMLPGEPFPAGIDIFSNGNFVEGAFRFGANQTREESIDKIHSLLRGIDIRQVKSSLRTRMSSIELEEAPIVWCKKCDQLIEDCVCPPDRDSDDCPRCKQKYCRCAPPPEEPENPGSSGGGGGGGGGYRPPGNGNSNSGNNNNNNNTVTKKINSKIVTIPPQLAKQRAGRCMAYSLYYTFRLLGKEARITKLVIKLQKYGIDFVNEGMSIQKFNYYIEDYCNYSNNYPDRADFSYYTSAVDQGYFIIVGINNGVDEDGKTVSHALLVIGYDSDNTLITLDPLTGKERELDKNEVKSFSKPFSPK